MKEKVKDFSKNFDNNTVSISIRSWKEWKERQVIFDIENVYKIMDKLNNKNFFCSCDSKDVLEKIVSRYKEKVLYYPKRTTFGDTSSVSAMQDILIDAMLLSKNKLLVVSLLSTFPELVWWFGGCKQEVIVIPPKTYFFMVRTHICSLFWKLRFSISLLDIDFEIESLRRLYKNKNIILRDGKYFLFEN